MRQLTKLVFLFNSMLCHMKEEEEEKKNNETKNQSSTIIIKQK